MLINDFQCIYSIFRQSTKIDWRYTEEGEKVRVSIRTGRIIPIPLSNLETIDYKHPNLYREQAKDTTKANVEKITFKVISQLTLE